jgi:DNA repair exonuclease SbcCD ATPase subunit
MRIELVNFRKHSHKILDLNGSAITYLHGDNGAGKSTIFVAINWVLFGKEQLLAPRGQPKVTTTVILTDVVADGLVITRTSNPPSLIVTDNRTFLIKDISAQNYISTLVSYEKWNMTSYIPQGKIHPLLSGKSSNLIDQLNQIAENGDDPSKLIADVAKDIVHYERELAIIDAEKNTYWRLYQEALMKTAVNTEWILPQNQENDMNQRRTNLALELRKQQTFIASQGVANERWKVLTNMVTTTEAKLSTYPDGLEAKVCVLQAAQTVFHHNERLQKEITQLLLLATQQPILLTVPTAEIREQWLQYQRYQTTVQQLRITDLPTEILQCERLIAAQPQFVINDQYLQFQDLIKKTVTAELLSPTELQATIEAVQTTLNTRTTEHQADSARLNLLNAQATTANTLIKSKRTQELTAQAQAEQQTATAQLVPQQQLLLSTRAKIAELNRELALSTSAKACPICKTALFTGTNGEHAVCPARTIVEIQAELTKLQQDATTIRMALTEQEQRNQKAYREAIAVIATTVTAEHPLILQPLPTLDNTATYAELGQLRARLQIAQQQVLQQQQLADYSTKNLVYVEITERRLTQQELELTKQRLTICQNIQPVSQPLFTLAELDYYERYYQIQAQCTQLRGRLQIEEIPFDGADLFRSQQQLTEWKGWTVALADYRKQLQTLEYLDLTAHHQYCDQAAVEVEQLDVKLKQSRDSRAVMDIYLRYNSSQLQYNATYNTLEMLRAFRTESINSQNDAHTLMLQVISNTVNFYLAWLFDTPIKINFSMASMKRGNMDASKLNVSLNYLGEEVTSFKSLSDGELRCISIVLFLAFNAQRGSNIIILDESINCIAPARRDTLLGVIAKLSVGRAVLMTCHGLHTGMFEYIVEI